MTTPRKPRATPASRRKTVPCVPLSLAVPPVPVEGDTGGVPISVLDVGTLEDLTVVADEALINRLARSCA